MTPAFRDLSETYTRRSETTQGKADSGFGPGPQYERMDPPSDGTRKRKRMALAMRSPDASGELQGGAAKWAGVDGLSEGAQRGRKTLSVLQRGGQARVKGQGWGQSHDD